MTQKYEQLMTLYAAMLIEDGFVYLNEEGLITSTNTPCGEPLTED